MGEKIIFTNSLGLSVELGNERPFILTKIEGAGAVTADIQTQKSPFQDGETYIDNVLEPRSLAIEIMIIAENAEEMIRRRRELIQVFSPKLGLGKLIYEFGNCKKEIEVISELAPVFPDAGDFKDTMQPGLITLYCPNPFWFDITIREEEMAAWIGGLTFALLLPITFAEQGEQSYKVVNNDGDVETPVLLEFFGPAVNPKIENNTTGEYIRIKRDLLVGQKLVINTEFGNKFVKLVEGEAETNAMHWIDLNSTFWQLKPGGNYISYSADAGIEDAWVKITWKNRYVGV